VIPTLLALLACGSSPVSKGGVEVSVGSEYDASLRRLTAAQYDNTVRDLFYGVEIPSQNITADPQIYGFDNNPDAQVSSALLVEKYQTAAIEVTALAMADDVWLGCPIDGGADPGGCGRQILEDFGPRAFRRPLTDEEAEGQLAFFDQMLQEEGFEVAIQLALQAILNSPEFLFFPEFGGEFGRGGHLPLSSYELASRLSYFLWNTMPDDTLLAAAEAGQLDSADGVEAEAWRMLDDEKVAGALTRFHHAWLGLDRLKTVAPDPDEYPRWSEDLRLSMEAENDALITTTTYGDEPTLSALLMSRQTTADDLLAEIYGIEVGTEFLPEIQRAGLLTRAAWLAATSHPIQPSPVQRGVFVLERVMCIPVEPPPPDVNVDVPDPSEPTTNRERYVAHTADPACSGCHSAIDPIGFGFEKYNSIGQYRIMDYGVSVDATGTFADGDLAGESFDGAVSLSALLARSSMVHDCYARNWLRYAHGAEVELGTTAEAFKSTGGQLPQLLVDIARSERFRSLR